MKMQLNDAFLIKQMTLGFLQTYHDITNPRDMVHILHEEGVKSRRWGSEFASRMQDPEFSDKAEQGLINAVKRYRRQLKEARR